LLRVIHFRMSGLASAGLNATPADLDVQARGAELNAGGLGPTGEAHAQLFLNGGLPVFANGGFRNGGFRNGGFLNGGRFLNGGGFRNARGFRNGFRNGGGFRNR
jgi:hypothetical protein